MRRDEQRLARYKDHIRKCRIYAPQDGMVVYGRGIREGVSVYQRRTILKLPNLSNMQVKATVHESGVNQVRPGRPATVRLDARPDESYRGSVKSVAVLPDQGGWLNSDVKWYETIVTIDEKVQGMRPGMTALVEIDVANKNDVLLAPVEAVVEIDGDHWCYVEADGDVERRLVSLGGTNDEFVEVRDGLDEGDRLVLNTTALLSEPQRAISSEYELSDILR
jgi:RND family efflux transporter MFP subunit